MSAPELNSEQISALLKLYAIGDLRDCRADVLGARNNNYRLETETGRYWLRVNADRPFWDLVLEKDALLFLKGRGLGTAVPGPVANVIGGYLTPVGQAVYATLFSWLEGRRLGCWEIEPCHSRQVGAFLARLHITARAFRTGRRRAPPVPFLRTRLGSMRGLSPVLREEVAWLDRTAARIGPLIGRRLPLSLLHGGVSPRNSRFKQGRLCGVTDFESVSRGPCVHDIGVAINNWTWRAETGFVPELARALLSGYQSVRPLRPSERNRLGAWTTFAALHICGERIREFETDPGARSGLYRDFRHYADRIHALDLMPRRMFAEWSTAETSSG